MLHLYRALKVHPGPRRSVNLDPTSEFTFFLVPWTRMYTLFEFEKGKSRNLAEKNLYHGRIEKIPFSFLCFIYQTNEPRSIRSIFGNTICSLVAKSRSYFLFALSRLSHPGKFNILQVETSRNEGVNNSRSPF